MSTFVFKKMKINQCLHDSKRKEQPKNVKDAQKNSMRKYATSKKYFKRKWNVAQQNGILHDRNIFLNNGKIWTAEYSKLTTDEVANMTILPRQKKY